MIPQRSGGSSVPINWAKFIRYGLFGILALMLVYSLSSLEQSPQPEPPRVRAPTGPKGFAGCRDPPPKLLRMPLSESMQLSRDVDKCVEVSHKPASFFQQMAGKLNMMLKSIFVSLANRNFEIRLWTNDPTRIYNLLDGNLLRKINVVKWDAIAEAAGTPFEKLGPSYLNLNDGLNYRGGDLLRLIVLYNYGGMYMDIDTLMLRDPTPLFATDFVTHWECIDNRLNGAIMYAATPKSKFISKLAESSFAVKDSQSSTAWGTDILSPLANSQVEYNFTVLPNCYWDVGWSLNVLCHSEKYKGGSLETTFDSDVTYAWAKTAADAYPGIFGYHWHNRWEKTPVKNSIGDLLFKDIEERYSEIYKD